MQDTPASDHVPSNYIWLQVDQQFSRHGRNSHIWLYKFLTVTLILKIADSSSCVTLGLMMVYHNTKFGYKRFSRWGDIVQMNSQWKIEPFLWPWPWPKQSYPIFAQDNPTYNVPSNQLSCKKVQQFRRFIRKSYIDYMIRHFELGLEDSKLILLKDNISPYRLVVKCSMVQKIPSGQTLIDILNLYCNLSQDSSNPFFFTRHTSRPSLVAKESAVQKV